MDRRKCRKCGVWYTPRVWNQVYCGAECRGEVIGDRVRRTRAIRSLKTHCEICGYNKWLPCLEFHHVCPDERKFQLSQGGSYSHEAVEEELNKCVVLCCNCHQEVHRGKEETIAKVDEIARNRI